MTYDTFVKSVRKQFMAKGHSLEQMVDRFNSVETIQRLKECYERNVSPNEAVNRI